jgi:endonuclease/exonuclease/phosphatase family metal-dependent hydrolase
MDQRARSELLVMTQNAWGGAPLWHRREARLARILHDLRPAVLGLQEIHAAAPTGDDSQAHGLARRAGGYRASFWPGEIAEGGACEGVALLCRDDVEVLGQAVIRLSLDRDDPLDRVTQRVLARTSIRFAGEVVDVLVAHLSISKRARARTVAEVLAFAAEGRVASGSRGALLMGDLNASPKEAPIQDLSKAWTDAWATTHPGEAGGTWPVIAPIVRIDYVFAQLGEGWAIEDCKRLPFAGCDHRGLMAVVSLPHGTST